MGVVTSEDARPMSVQTAIALPAAVLALAAPAAATAATASVSGAAVRYVAGPGERNTPSLTLSLDRRTVTVRDPGAAIVAVDGCTAIDDHEARCAVPAEASPVAVSVALGDGDDVLTGVTLLGAALDIDAGPGDDHVEARSGDIRGGEGADVLQGSGSLDGGPGDDVLEGGFASDSLAGGPGRDRIDGGPGSDTVSWADESRPVAVDLGFAGPAGPADEPDDVRNVESAAGGAGNDVLPGPDDPNQLPGGRGDDVLDGRGGSDWVDGGAGADRLSGGAGRDRLHATDLGPGVEDVIDGGADGDWIKSDSAGSVVLGGGGADDISYAGRVSRVDGGRGPDYLQAAAFGGAGARVRSGSGRDHIRGVADGTPVPRDCDVAVLVGSDVEVENALRVRGSRLVVPLPRDCILATCPLR